eukprot:tig00000190_g13872.t1
MAESEDDPFAFDASPSTAPARVPARAKATSLFRAASGGVRKPAAAPQPQRNAALKPASSKAAGRSQSARPPGDRHVLFAEQSTVHVIARRSSSEPPARARQIPAQRANADGVGSAREGTVAGSNSLAAGSHRIPSDSHSEQQTKHSQQQQQQQPTLSGLAAIFQRQRREPAPGARPASAAKATVPPAAAGPSRSAAEQASSSSAAAPSSSRSVSSAPTAAAGASEARAPGPAVASSQADSRRASASAGKRPAEATPTKAQPPSRAPAPAPPAPPAPAAAAPPPKQRRPRKKAAAKASAPSGSVRRSARVAGSSAPSSAAEASSEGEPPPQPLSPAAACPPPRRRAAGAAASRPSVAAERRPYGPTRDEVGFEPSPLPASGPAARPSAPFSDPPADPLGALRGLAGRTYRRRGAGASSPSAASSAFDWESEAMSFATSGAEGEDAFEADEVGSLFSDTTRPAGAGSRGAGLRRAASAPPSPLPSPPRKKRRVQPQAAPAAAKPAPGPRSLSAPSRARPRARKAAAPARPRLCSRPSPNRLRRQPRPPAAAALPAARTQTTYPSPSGPAVRLGGPALACRPPTRTSTPAGAAPRRSSRARIAPLQFWAGERIVYGVDKDSGVPRVVGVEKRTPPEAGGPGTPEAHLEELVFASPPAPPGFDAAEVETPAAPEGVPEAAAPPRGRPARASAAPAAGSEAEEVASADAETDAEEEPPTPPRRVSALTAFPAPRQPPPRTAARTRTRGVQTDPWAAAADAPAPAVVRPGDFVVRKAYQMKRWQSGVLFLGEGAGSAVASSRHTQVFFVKSGRVEAREGPLRLPLDEGDWAFFKPGADYELVNAGKGEAHVVFCLVRS